MADDLFIVHADGIQILLTDHGAKLLIQSANQVTIEKETIKLGLKNIAMIHLSLEHLKFFTILAHRQLKEYEGKNEPITLPKAIVEERKIDVAKDW